MSEEANNAGGGAPAGNEAPTNTNTQTTPEGGQPGAEATGGQPTNPPEGGQAAPGGIQVPEDFKQAAWLAKVQGDNGEIDTSKVFSQLDNLNKAVGKKTVGLPDWNNPEAVEEYYSKVRPEDKAAYQFGEGVNPEFETGMREVFHKTGLNEKQAADLLAGYGEVEAKIQKEHFGKEEFTRKGMEKFSNEWESAQQNMTHMLKFATDNGVDVQALNNLPNSAMIALVDVLNTTYKKFNVSAETGLNTPANQTTAREKHSDVFKGYQEASQRPMSSEERANWLKRLENSQK